MIQLAMQSFLCENFIGIALIAMHDNALSTIPNSEYTPYGFFGQAVDSYRLSRSQLNGSL